MTVKFFASTDKGMPTPSSAAGALAAFLDVCLNTGYNAQTATSLTQAAGTATMVLNSGHGFNPDQRVLVSGANEAGYNGEQTVLTTTSTSITFAVPSSAAATATGTVSVKVAPLGWNIAFTGTNKRVYTPSVPQSLGFFLRVDDTGSVARVRGYESMTDVDTGVGPFPTDGQISGGGFWSKQYSNYAVQWALFGDERLFYLLLFPQGVSSVGPLVGFGDINAQSSADAYACMLACVPTDFSYSNGALAGDLSFPQQAGSNGIFFPRGYTQTGSAKQAFLASFGIPMGSVYSGTGNTNNGSAVGLSFPNPADNGIFVNAPYVGHDAGLRGQLPGLYHTCQNWFSSYNHRDKIPGTDALVGKKLMAIRTGTPSGGLSYFGMVGIDITGPWR
ncbi:hypothetical protein [Ralstonia sp. ASV6]|uniref:hypothetical protein n=1 Tax=Ralstonia sp. ASV6 TaxID=2795124 RepID=UPI0018EA35BA|nr:hypothetical protein [Ralstonia sp. ASV6]